MTDLQQYQTFIEQCTSTAKSVKNYSDFKRINECIIQLGYKKTLLDFDNSIDVINLINLLNKQDLFLDYNSKGNNQYANTLMTYLRFLKAKELFQLNPTNSKQPNVEITQNEKLDINIILTAIRSTNLIYSDDLIIRYAYSLMTKPFAILSGLAGSGKTQLAIALAHSLSEDIEEQVCLVPVGADWTNREPLLGYPNALKSNEYATPENGVLDFIIRADKNPQKPYFLILDEMNLSYVERYFADFLSVMESGKEIPLWENGNDEVPASIKLPKNLYITGTINVDETTYMFSPKVLDRANVIEFKVTEDDMVEFLKQNPEVNICNANGQAASIAQAFVEHGNNVTPSTIADEKIKEFFKQLKTVNAEFGYRSATEMRKFINLVLQDNALDENTVIDAAIVQKMLPKLHGSRKKLDKVLSELWKLCFDKNAPELIEDATTENAIYPLSADKILRMYKCAHDNGFTSFAEA